MDLWESSTHFLCSRLAHPSQTGNFLASDFVALAFKWGVKIKPKSSSIQESFRDLLIQLRDQNPEINAYSLVGRLGEVKKFEILSNDLKSFLIRESILFVGSASKRIEDLSRTLENQDQQIRSLKDRSNLSISSPGPTRSRSGQRSRSRLRRHQLATDLNFMEEDEEELGKFVEEDSNEDWKFAFEKLSQQMSEQKKSITKLSKLSLGSLSAIDKLETQLSESKQNGLSHNSGRGQQTDDRLAKLEADIHKLAKLYKGSQETVRSLEFKLSKIGKENGMTANEMSSQTEERLKRLEEGNDIIQSQVQKLDSRLDHLGNHVTETEKFLTKKTDDAISGMTREEVEQILEEFWIKNQEQFVPETTWEERSSYWEEKFSQGLAALESELKESKNEIEKNWTACQEMFEKTGPNVDPKSPKLPKSPKIEKANLEILKKFEEIKNQAKVLESTASLLQNELKHCHSEQSKKLEVEQKNREAALVIQKSALAQLDERIKQSDKSNSEKLAALKKLVETIKTDVSNNRDNFSSESEILKQNFVNLETRMSKMDEREKSELKKFENVLSRVTICEKSVKDLSGKSLISDIEQKIKNFAKNSEETSNQIASLKNQIGAIDKVIESGGLKTLGVELKSKISVLEKKFQEKKDDLETLKRNSTELSKNVDKCEKENSKQIENLNGKVSILEKSVNTQIPKELSKIESMQKMISENEKSVSTLKKSLDANGQEVEKLKTKVGQVITKSEVQVKIENLENKIEIKFESALKKNTDGQNILSEWLATLSKKSEENEKSIETLKKNLDTSGQDLELVKTKFGQIVSKNEFQIFEKKFETKLKQNHDALTERFSILDKNFLENEKFGKSQITKLENFCNEIQNKCNDKSKLLTDDFKGLKSETSEMKSLLELKLKKMKDDETLNLNSLAKKFEDNKSEINDLLKKSETQYIDIGDRLAESEKWMSELKTNLSFLISESDLIKANLKKYQDTFEQDLIKTNEKVAQMVTTSDHFRKNFENQMIPSLEFRMEQIENGFEIGLKKMEKESEIKQKNLISELDCKIQVSLLDLETNLIKEVENSNSKFAKLKEESHRFESRLSDLAIKSDSNHDLIQSIDKELGRQLKELTSKSEIENLKSDFEKFIADLNLKCDQINNELIRIGDVANQTKSDSNRDFNEFKIENETRLQNYVENFQQNLFEVRQHLTNLSSNLSELSIFQTDLKSKMDSSEKEKNENGNIFEQISKIENRSRQFESKLSELEFGLQQLNTNAENDRMEIFGEIHSNVKNLNENLRHRFEDFAQKFDDLSRHCNLIEGISSALDHLRSDINKLSSAVLTIDANEKKFLGDLHSFTDQMGKNSSQLGHLHAKVDNKEKEMGALTQKIESLKKEFFHFAERIDGSENHLWGDVCTLQEKLSQFEKELCHSADEWKKSQMVTLQRIEQLKESIKVSDELNECYKERDARKIDYLENKLMEEKEQVNNILNQLSEIQNWRQKSALLVV